jgi:hypothetical protein
MLAENYFFFDFSLQAAKKRSSLLQSHPRPKPVHRNLARATCTGRTPQSRKPGSSRIISP